MSVIILLIAVSLAMALLFLVFFVWSAQTGQFDDDFTPSLRMLDEESLNPEKNEQ